MLSFVNVQKLKIISYVSISGLLISTIVLKVIETSHFFDYITSKSS